MKLNDIQIRRLSQKILFHLKQNNAIIFKTKEEIVEKRIISLVKQNYQEEIELENEVNKMMDQLERAHSGEFQRYKMFPLLKKKLAKEKGIVL